MYFKAIAYCGIGRADQTNEEKYSIDTQKELISRYAEQHNIDIVNWYTDEDEGSRGDSLLWFNQLLSGNKTNPSIQYFIVAKPEFLAKDVILYFAYKYRLEQRGISLISVIEDWSVQENQIGHILDTFIDYIKQIESNDIKSRMSSGRAYKAKHGGYAGGQSPYGYKVVGGKLIIDEYESAVVKYIYQLHSEGMSTHQIQKEVNEEGFLTRSGKEFAYTTVKHILENERTYRGEYRYGKEGIWVKGEQEPILKD